MSTFKKEKNAKIITIDNKWPWCEDFRAQCTDDSSAASALTSSVAKVTDVFMTSSSANLNLQQAVDY